jgi:hypothetical protein
MYNNSKVTKNQYYYLFRFTTVASRLFINGGPKVRRNNIGRKTFLRTEISNSQTNVFAGSRRKLGRALVVN